MLKKLLRNLKPDPMSHEDAQVRLQALATSNIDQNTLFNIVTSDNNAEVRESACSQLTDKNTLIALSKQPKIQDIALKQWAQLLSDAQHTSEYEAEQIITECTDTSHLVAIISHCPNKKFAELALAGLKDEASLLDIMANTKNHRFNLQAIDKIKDAKNLKLAASLVKGRDKKSLQRIKEKQRELMQEQQLIENIQHQKNRLLDKAKALLKQSSPMNLKGEILHIKQEWKALNADDQKKRITHEYAEEIEQLIKSLELLWEDQHHTEQEKNKIKAEQSALESMEKQLHAFRLSCQQTLSKVELENQINTLSHLKHDDLFSHPRLKETTVNIEKLLAFHQQNQCNPIFSLTQEDLEKSDLKALKRNAKHIEAIINKGRGIGLSKTYIASLNTIKNTINESLSVKKQENQEAQKTLMHMLSECEDWLDDKNDKPVRKQLTLIKQLAAKLDQHQIQQHQAAINRIYKRLQDLTEWQEYSTDPKRHKLIEDMNSLANTEQEANERLKQIKELQKQWKALGYCQNKNLWQAFQTASDTAYAPCKENFSAQRKLRRFNAEQKNEICQQLESFLEKINNTSNQLDWKNIRGLSRNIINEWKKFNPVEPKQHKVLQQRFSKSFDALNDKIQHQQKLTEEQLERLYHAAEALQDEENIQEAMTSYQMLVKQWKKTNQEGISRHKQQQAYWEKFKAAGDKLYNERQLQTTVLEKNQLETVAQAEQLIKAIQHLSTIISNKDDQTIGEERVQVQQAIERFNAIDTLPKNKIHALSMRFDEAKDNYQLALKKASHNTFIKTLDTLTQFGQSCCEAERLDATASISLPESFDKHWQEKLQERFRNQDSEEELIKKAKLICIQIELLNGVDIPTEDIALKMELQMQALSNHFGSTVEKDHHKILEALYLSWFSLPSSFENHSILEQRFLAAVQK